MQLNDDGARASLSIDGTFNAEEIENLVRALMELRARMTPAVSLDRPGPESPPGLHAAAHSEPHMQLAALRTGGFRLWIRHAGAGWMTYEISARHALGLARYILSRVDGSPGLPDLFGQERDNGPRQ